MSLTPSAHHLPYSAPTTPANHSTVVGFIGLGNMGAIIAKNLAVYTATHKPGSATFLLWNRTKEKAVKVLDEVEERLSSGGGMPNVSVADTIEELTTESDIIILSMASDAALLEIVQKLAGIIKGGQPKQRIVVDTSTVYPTTSGKVDSILTAEPHTHFVASPVFGAPQAAKEAKLIVCLAGDYASKKKIAYLLVPAAGRKVIDLGGNVEKVLAFKLLGNAYIAGTVELLSELHTLSEKVGVGSQAFHDLMCDMFAAPSIMNYSRRILQDDFDAATGFHIDGGLKDVHHAQRLASEHDVPVPIVDIAHQHLLTARALNSALPAYQQNTNLDWSSMVSASRMAAGMDPFDSQKHKTGPIPEPEQ